MLIFGASGRNREILNLSFINDIHIVSVDISKMGTKSSDAERRDIGKIF
jgi:hypothetical protein